MGHSIGEYVAAHLAGVFSLEDALALVAQRGRLMQGLPGGAMLAVSLPAHDVAQQLPNGLGIAAINAPDLCVVSGPVEAIDQLAKRLAMREVQTRRLHTSHAFHCQLVDPVIDAYTLAVQQFRLGAPKTPFVSNLSGTWITDEQATDPSYWARHMRQTVRFSDGLTRLLETPQQLLLEVGPGQTLGTLARRHPENTTGQVVLASLPHPQEKQPDDTCLLNTAARAWLAGATLDWSPLHERSRRVSLPTYPFERQRYWVDSQDGPAAPKMQAGAMTKKPSVVDWLYLPAWKLYEPPHSEATATDELRWLVFEDGRVCSDQVTERLGQLGHVVTRVRAGSHFEQTDERSYTVRPHEPGDYVKLLATLPDAPQAVAHLWNTASPDASNQTVSGCQDPQLACFYSLLHLTDALGTMTGAYPISVKIVSSGAVSVLDTDQLLPHRAILLGACRVIPQEYPNLSCFNIDLAPTAAGDKWPTPIVESVVRELTCPSTDPVVAYRGTQRAVQSFEPVGAVVDNPAALRSEGVYLITGGLGGVGLLLAEHLARVCQAKLVLVGRTAMPPRGAWDPSLAGEHAGDAIGQKIRAVRALEALGAEVLVASADVGVRDQMASVIGQTEDRFGTIHGVIHAAGLVGRPAYCPIRDLTPDRGRQQFWPKVHGLRVLEELLAGRDLDFCLLTASLSSVVGGLGHAAYAAANAFMDAFVVKQRRAAPGTPWISVDWDSFRIDQSTTDQGAVSELHRLAMTRDEAVHVFDRILSMGSVPRVVVSTADLSVRIDRWVNPKAPDAHIDAKATAPRHARPAIQSAYIAPGNAIEQRVADIWQNLLGIDKVGIHDNFFELGGHSLLAIQVVNKIKVDLDADITTATLFEGPTVHSLSKIIQDADGGPSVLGHSDKRGKRRKSNQEAIKEGVPHG